jgi:hypothetical protein
MMPAASVSLPLPGNEPSKPPPANPSFEHLDFAAECVSAWQAGGVTTLFAGLALWRFSQRHVSKERACAGVDQYEGGS